MWVFRNDSLFESEADSCLLDSVLSLYECFLKILVGTLILGTSSRQKNDGVKFEKEGMLSVVHSRSIII